MDLGHDDSGGGLGGMFEKMPSLDLITVLVLGFNAYILYNQLGYNQGSLTSVTTDPHVIATQLSIVLVLVYGIEFIHDRKSGGH